MKEGGKVKGYNVFNLSLDVALLHVLHGGSTSLRSRAISGSTRRMNQMVAPVVWCHSSTPRASLRESSSGHQRYNPRSSNKLGDWLIQTDHWRGNDYGSPLNSLPTIKSRKHIVQTKQANILMNKQQIEYYNYEIMIIHIKSPWCHWVSFSDTGIVQISYRTTSTSTACTCVHWCPTAAFQSKVNCKSNITVTT